jgi:hypothetical protein
VKMCLKTFGTVVRAARTEVDNTISGKLFANYRLYVVTMKRRVMESSGKMPTLEMPNERNLRVMAEDWKCQVLESSSKTG